MSCFAARLSRVYVATDINTPVFVQVGKVTSASISGEVDTLECTSYDSTTREYIPNFFTATMDMEMRWKFDDAGQTIIHESVFPSTALIRVRFDIPNLAGEARYEADAFVTSYAPATDLDEVASWSVTFQLSDVELLTQ